MESIKAMSVHERLQLIEAIWQSLDESEVRESAEELSLLKERHEDYKANPGKTESWEDFKNRVIKKYT